MDVAVSRLLEEKGKEFGLELVAGMGGLSRVITQSELHRPGLALAGFLEIFTYDRIQIVGNTETRYLQLLSPEARRRNLEAIFAYPIPCVIVTTGNVPAEELLQIAEEKEVPVLRTEHPTTHFNAMMTFWLEREFAPATAVHAVFVDVFGEGVLMMGGSGIGKSECGLELIERGHRLVADDMVILRRLGTNILMGSAATTIQHHMEVRGLGIIDVELLFGIGAVREEKRVSLVVELDRFDEEDQEIDRLGIDPQMMTLLDVPVRRFKIPVDSGRNVSILIEVAALQHRILERGRNPAEELNQRLISQMTGGNR